MKKSLLFLFLGFFFVFMGFDSAQYYLSSIFYTANIKTISLISLALVYATFSIATFFSPYFCQKLGIKKSLFISSLFYAFFVLSLLSKLSVIIYIFSIFLGIAASLIWTAQGTYLIEKTNEKNRGFYSGLFFATIPLGPAFMTFLISFFVESVNYIIIYAGLFGLILCGSFFLLFTAKNVSQPSVAENKKLNPYFTIRKKEMLLLVPFFVGSAFMNGLFMGAIPIRITDLFGLSFVGKLISVFTLSTVILAVIIGKLSDKFGVKKFIYFSLSMSIVALAMMFFTKSIVLFGSAVFILAINHASFGALSYPIISKLFKEEISSAVAIRWMMFGLAVFLSLILPIFLNFSIMMFISSALVVLALIFIRALFNQQKIY